MKAIYKVIIIRILLYILQIFLGFLKVVPVISDSAVDLIQCYYLHKANLWLLALGLVYYRLLSGIWIAQTIHQ